MLPTRRERISVARKASDVQVQREKLPKSVERRTAVTLYRRIWQVKIGRILHCVDSNPHSTFAHAQTRLLHVYSILGSPRYECTFFDANCLFFVAAKLDGLAAICSLDDMIASACWVVPFLESATCRCPNMFSIDINITLHRSALRKVLVLRYWRVFFFRRHEQGFKSITFQSVHARFFAAPFSGTI
jgi:hypothetical protein